MQVAYKHLSKSNFNFKKHHMLLCEMISDLRKQGPASTFDASILESLNLREKAWWMFSNKQLGDSIFTFHVCICIIEGVLILILDKPTIMERSICLLVYFEKAPSMFKENKMALLIFTKIAVTIARELRK